MNLTLHLTNKCNLKCKYCFVPHGIESMTADIAMKAVDFAIRQSEGQPVGLLFYGGEPLLERQLIYHIVNQCSKIKQNTGQVFYYKMTSNCILLDEEFLQFAEQHNITIGMSCDGPAQDDCRLFPNGKGSFSILEEKIPLLLKYQPYAVGMSVIDSTTIHKAAEVVQYLFDCGFRYITQSLNYCRTATWTEDHLEVMEKQFWQMAEMYIKWTRAEEKFYLAPIDMKIISHLKGENYNPDRRKMALNQLSVAPSGRIYSASRFVDDSSLAIGDVYKGLDLKKQQEIYDKGSDLAEPCSRCKLSGRCNYAYDSLRKGEDGALFTDIAPLQCVNEQMLAPIADYVAGVLYKEKNPMFLHKHYNEFYPIMSLLEDRG